MKTMETGHDLTCDQAEEAFAAAALGALDPDEQASFEAHLCHCDRCRERFSAYERVSSELAESAGEIAPPDSLRARLLDDIAREPRSAVVDATNEKRRRGIVVPLWAVGVAAAAAVLLLVALGILVGQLRDARDQRDAAMADTRLVASYVAAGGTVTKLVSVENSTYPGSNYQGRGALLTAPEKEPLVIVAGCTPTADDLWYHVWVANGGQRTDLGEMVVGSDWSGRFAIDSDLPISDFDQIGVTIVHGDGAKQDVLVASAPEGTL